MIEHLDVVSDSTRFASHASGILWKLLPRTDHMIERRTRVAQRSSEKIPPSRFHDLAQLSPPDVKHASPPKFRNFLFRVKVGARLVP
jgi:hypothetical protein